MRRFFAIYLKSYHHLKKVAFTPKNLLYTNVTISVGISMTGDCIQQHYELVNNQSNNYDLERSLQMGFTGSVAGVLCHYWYNYLDKIIVGRTFDMIIKKLLLDQCIMSPIIIITFFATVAIFEENPIKNFNEEVSDKFMTLYKAEWVVWPPAQIINFYFLPTKYRVTYDNTISLGYDVYTSQVKHSNHHKDSEEKKI